MKTTCLIPLLICIAFIITGIESMHKNVYNVVILGNTGVGKSSLLNMFHISIKNDHDKIIVTRYLFLALFYAMVSFV